MKYPDFYNQIETIKLQDELSHFLGATQDGMVEFSYLDIVKGAGHSCPTVLGAYLMTCAALNELYQDEIPQRGEIKVFFKEKATDGVTGVISNVIKNITGATTNTGFKGIAGNFDRRHLMFFEEKIASNVRFTRRDSKQSVDIFYDPSSISPDANMSPLMQKCVSKMATSEEKKEFGKLWQQRVENIYLNKDNVIKVHNVEV